MRIVIQCAARKHPAASFLVNGRTVLFVTRPDLAPPCEGRTYARPDDVSDDGRTWRQRLLRHNRAGGNNPLGFRPAYRLYRHDVYRELVEALLRDALFGVREGSQAGTARGDSRSP